MQILADALPGIAARATDFHVIPHGRDFERFVQCADTGHVGAGEPLRILVPSNIGVHKGSGLIAQIKQLDTSGQFQFNLLGTGDSDLKDCVVEQGAYERTPFAELARSERGSVWERGINSGSISGDPKTLKKKT